MKLPDLTDDAAAKTFIGADARVAGVRRLCDSSRMPSSALKRCFISAPAGSDTAPLRHALNERGIVWTDSTTAPVGISVLQSVETALRDADFVCVLLGDATSGNVIFELGMARGLGLPVLVFVDPDADVPAEVSALSYARIDLRNTSALGLHLDAFLGHARPHLAQQQRPRAPVRARRKSVTWAREALATSRDLDASALEDIVRRLFEQSGAILSPASPASGPDTGADLAVWVDELHSTLGNPLLVEVKLFRAPPSQSQLSQLMSRLRHTLAQFKARAGLMVYWEPTGASSPPPEPLWPLVIPVTVSELVDVVGRGGMYEDLVARRNRAVHAAS